MNFKKFHKSKNLFDYSTVTTGYRIAWSTGEPFSDATGIISDYIEVTEGTRYNSSPNPVYVIGYDANKTYIGVFNSVSGWIKASTNSYYTFVIPQDSGCKYIKLMSFGGGSSANPLSENTMFNSGNEALPYEPYSSEVWHDIPNYKRSVLVWNTDTTYERDSGAWT